MRTLSALCLVTLFALTTAGCGQKGDLYFPNDQDKPAASSTAQ